jgi:hypothetical protein
LRKKNDEENFRLEASADSSGKAKGLLRFFAALRMTGSKLASAFPDADASCV